MHKSYIQKLSKEDIHNAFNGFDYKVYNRIIWGDTKPQSFEFPSKEELDKWEQENNKAIDKLDYWIKVIEYSMYIIAFAVFLFVWRLMI